MTIHYTHHPRYNKTGFREWLGRPQAVLYNRLSLLLLFLLNFNLRLISKPLRFFTVRLTNRPVPGTQGLTI